MRRNPMITIAAATALSLLGAVTMAAASTSERSGPASLTSASKNALAAHAAHPTRILSLSASATQMLYAIGAGNQVVGVDKYSTYPANAPRTGFTGYETSAEDYLPKHPDLVILAFDSTHLVAQLQKLHIATLLLPPANNLADTERQISQLGSITGHAGGAARTVSSINADVRKVTQSVGNRAKGATYYIEIDPTYYSATSKTFIGTLFARLGMQNIADKAARAGTAYPQISAEYLLKANPDYIFLADTTCCGQTPTSFAKRPGFATMQAVHLGHVIAINDSLASEWGPHSLEAFFSIIADAVIDPGAIKQPEMASS